METDAVNEVAVAVGDVVAVAVGSDAEGDCRTVAAAVGYDCSWHLDPDGYCSCRFEMRLSFW